MDALRSCYTTTMRFPHAGLVRVRWYWTDKPLLGKETIYGSHNHSRDEGWEDWDTGEPGEVWGAERVYDRGDPPTDLCCDGPRGSDAAWVGENSGNDPLYVVPLCIHSVGSGGVSWTGTGNQSVAGSGGLGWSGTGLSSLRGTGGISFAGTGAVVLGSSGGVVLGGGGRESLIGSGGSEWAGSGGTIFFGQGGEAWAGDGSIQMIGSGGVSFSGKGKLILPGQGGMEWAGYGILAVIGSGGVEWAGEGVEEVSLPGEVIWYGSNTTPSGYLPCDGAAVSRSTYAALFAVIGTTFGAGNGTTTFNVPDLRGRTAIGTGTGTGLTARTLAGTVGAEGVALVTAELPSHTHPAASGQFLLGGTGSLSTPGAGSTATTNANTGSTGSGNAHQNMQPSLVLTAYIKT